MKNSANSFFSTPFYPLVFPLLVVLLVIYHLLLFLHIPYALGFSVIVFTILIRVILYPITAAQLKVSKKMQEIAPHITKLKEKHKGDAKTLQQETMKLYKEQGVNPAAGCIPALVQLPVIFGLYQLLYNMISANAKQVMPAINSHLPSYLSNLRLMSPWDTHFFGIPLGQSISHLLQTVGPAILLIPILTAVLQFVQSKMITPSKSKKPAIKKQKDDFASAFQTQSLYLFPLMIGFFSFTLPFGLSLYWNTFTLFGILQQYRVLGVGGLSDYLAKLKKN